MVRVAGAGGEGPEGGRRAAGLQHGEARRRHARVQDGPARRHARGGLLVRVHSAVPR